MPYMVVVSGAGCERDCRKAVRGLGFATYQPTTRLQVVERGRKRWVERLLLGRYMFARHDDAVDWRRITLLREVHSLFMAPPPYDCAGSEPSLPSWVDDAEVEALRALEDRHGHVQLGRPGRLFARGQAVRAVTGVFAGFTGEYEDFRRGVDSAFLEIFGRKTRIEFAPGALAAA